MSNEDDDGPPRCDEDLECHLLQGIKALISRRDGSLFFLPKDKETYHSPLIYLTEKQGRAKKYNRRSVTISMNVMNYITEMNSGKRCNSFKRFTMLCFDPIQ